MWRLIAEVLVKGTVLYFALLAAGAATAAAPPAEYEWLHVRGECAFLYHRRGGEWYRIGEFNFDSATYHPRDGGDGRGRPAACPVPAPRRGAGTKESP